VDGWATFDPGTCAPPRRALDEAVSPSTIRLKQASTIAEIRISYAQFAENHRFQIPEGAHWNDVRQASKNVGAAIQKAMRAIDRKSVV
jgi:type I restriction-modification system DNA methylase subunit